MISRRPNNRASIEIAPGPSSTIALATVITSIAHSPCSTRLGTGVGSHARAKPAQPNPAIALPTGVRNPSNNDTPTATASSPVVQVVSVALSGAVR